jgi:predicted ferric reductase
VRTGSDRRLARAGLAATLTAIVVANAAWMVHLWVHGGNLHTHGTGDVLNSVGRLTGLLGAYLAVLQVVMLARLPLVDRVIGFDRMTVWHRRNGKACLTLIVAHTLTITAGYTLTDKTGLGAEISSLLGDYPGMVTATVGTGLMLVVVATSVTIARRRLPYELWYLVHLLAYASIALGYLHQIPTGNDLTTDHAAQRYWHLLYLVPLALVVVYRVVAPLLRSTLHGLHVDEVVHESETTVSLYLRGRGLRRLGARGGQFFLWRFLASGLWWESHPFSLSAAPQGDRLRITVKALGGYTRRLAAVPVGTRVIADGPFGHFTADRRRNAKVALVAGGIGITPVRALLEELGGAQDVSVIYRALTEEDVVFRAELDELAQRQGVIVHYVVGDHRDPAHGQLLEPDHLRGLVPDIAERDVYVCGPPAMVRALRRSLRAAAVPSRRLHVEEFALAA